MFNIEEQNNFEMHEFYCRHCERWFITKFFNGVIGCPYCLMPVELNGSFNIKDINATEI